MDQIRGNIVLERAENRYGKRLASSLKWQLWSAMYMVMVFGFTWINAELNIIVFGLYFLLALPFVFKPELYLLICYLFSTIAYFFCGADEGIYSIYTIMMVICALNLLLVRCRFRLSGVLLILGAAFLWLAWDSYKHSMLHYIMGLYAVFYVVVAAIAVSALSRPERCDIMKFWPEFAAVFFALCLVSCMLTGNGEFGRFSIHKTVNYNTFGMAMGQLAVIFAVTHFALGDKKRKLFFVLWIAALAMVMVSGSRSALMGSLCAFLIIQIVYNYRRKRAVKTLLMLLIGIAAVAFVVLPFLRFMGVDFSRFSVQDVLDTGASNRDVLWKTLIPEINNFYREYGLGPGHYCTSVLIKELLYVDYSHAHNLLLEAYCELGIRGLVVFAVLLFAALRAGFSASKADEKAYLSLACYLGLLINGIGEAYVCDIILWLLIGMMFSFKREPKTAKE